MSIFFRHEPENAYDPNAVGVWITARALFFFSSDVQIGYLNEDLAQEMARYIDKGGKLVGSITEVTGGSDGKPTLGVNILLTKA